MKYYGALNYKQLKECACVAYERQWIMAMKKIAKDIRQLREELERNMIEIIHGYHAESRLYSL